MSWMSLAPPGAADVCGILPGGQALQVECKTLTGQLRPEQIKWRAMVEKQGGRWMLVRNPEEDLRAPLVSKRAPL